MGAAYAANTPRRCPFCFLFFFFFFLFVWVNFVASSPLPAVRSVVRPCNPTTTPRDWPKNSGGGAPVSPAHRCLLVRDAAAVAASSRLYAMHRKPETLFFFFPPLPL